MAQTELILPKMGESVAEATIIKWLKSEGDSIEADESIVEIATDKVDSEIPAPISGILAKIISQEGETVSVGTVIAIIADAGETVVSDASTDSDIKEAPPEPAGIPHNIPQPTPHVSTDLSSEAPIAIGTEEEATAKGEADEAKEEPEVIQPIAEPSIAASVPASTSAAAPRFHKGRFYSPLVRKIATSEGITLEELEKVAGNGKNGRVTKKDILSFVGSRVHGQSPTPVMETPTDKKTAAPAPATAPASSGPDEIVEMDRMRKLIADHMVMSKHTSPHVTSFVEADVTGIVTWRNKIKDDFLAREGEKITFTPIFIEAVARAIRDFPMINVSVDDTSIIVKKDINIGIAVALPSGNLIVPVIRNADRMNLYGLTKAVNDLATRSRDNNLVPDEIQGGTFTLTNVGTFGNVMGTPIINQPQVAILATGTIQKKPVVIETPESDTIGIRSMMFLSLSYDHRAVDGALGGSFLRKVADYLEAFDTNTEF